LSLCHHEMNIIYNMLFCSFADSREVISISEEHGALEEVVGCFSERKIENRNSQRNRFYMPPLKVHIRLNTSFK